MADEPKDLSEKNEMEGEQEQKRELEQEGKQDPSAEQASEDGQETLAGVLFDFDEQLQVDCTKLSVLHVAGDDIAWTYNAKIGELRELLTDPYEWVYKHVFECSEEIVRFDVLPSHFVITFSTIPGGTGSNQDITISGVVGTAVITVRLKFEVYARTADHLLQTYLANRVIPPGAVKIKHEDSRVYAHLKMGNDLKEVAGIVFAAALRPITWLKELNDRDHEITMGRARRPDPRLPKKTFEVKKGGNTEEPVLFVFEGRALEYELFRQGLLTTANVCNITQGTSTSTGTTVGVHTMIVKAYT